MADASVHHDSGNTKGSTRSHRVDEEFLGLLEEDYGIPAFSLRRAFLGMPPAPKRQAIEICEWATSKAKTDDPEEAGRMVRGWARRRGFGQYHPAITGAPETTYEQNDHERQISAAGDPFAISPVLAGRS